MWGPSEFHVTGTLKDFDITARLAEIKVPTLWVCGQYDECTPEATAWYASLQPGSEMVVLENCSHTPMLEQPDSYNALIRSYLARIESPSPSL
jgi:proline iminopeptidase